MRPPALAPTEPTDPGSGRAASADPLDRLDRDRGDLEDRLLRHRVPAGQRQLIRRGGQPTAGILVPVAVVEWDEDRPGGLVHHPHLSDELTAGRTYAHQGTGTDAEARGVLRRQLDPDFWCPLDQFGGPPGLRPRVEVPRRAS